MTIGRRRITTLVLHHSAGEGNGRSIAADHIRRGWGSAFYHFIVERDGSLTRGRELARAGSSRRIGAIEICVVGKLHQREIFPEQEIRLRDLIRRLRADFPTITSFRNHRDFSATLCPGNIDIQNYI